MSGARASIVAVLMACVCAQSAAAATPAASTDQGRVAQLAEMLSRRVVETWMARQRPDGSFHDYVADRSTTKRDRYGPALLGTGLLLHGLRTKREAAIAGGLRAIGFALGLEHQPQPFEAMALASAYRAAQTALPHDGRRIALDAIWRERLMSFDVHRLTTAPPGRRDAYSNLRLVETLAALEGRAAGVAARRPGALLHPATAAGRVNQVLGRSLPTLADRERRRSRDGMTTVISDPPANPIAYHALSVGMLAQAIGLLGPQAPTHARRILVQGARASWAFMTPQGDVSWWGRGQSQSWTLAMTAYGVVAASRQPGVSDLTRGRLGAVALGALGRLATQFDNPVAGLWITPAFARDHNAAIRGLDFYAAAASYTALTLIALEWLAGDPALRAPLPLLGLAADGDDGVVIARNGTFATVRRGNVWMSVKERPAVPVHERADHSHDLRYDAGIGLALVRTAAGAWEPVMRPLPITRKWDAAGPALTVGGRRSRMVGRRMRVTADGTVTVSARFLTHGGDALRRALVRFTPTACGVRASVPGRARDTWDFSVFVNTHPYRVGDRAVSDGRVMLSASARATVTTDGPYASGNDPQLTRARLRVRLRRAGIVGFDVCRR